MLTRPLPWALAIGGLAFAIASAVTVYAEFMPLTKVGVTMRGKVDALVGQAIATGPSYRSKLLVLNSCNEALSSLEAAALPSEQLQSLYAHCGQIAQAIAAAEPSFSLAYYVEALIAEGQGDLDALNRHLAQSQRTAPGQGWLALSRAIVAARHLDRLDDEAAVALDHDIATLIRSGRGADWLAHSYVGGGPLAERITTIIERLPDDQQRRFLRTVRRLSTT